MTARPKTFNEFLKRITIVSTEAKGCKIICDLKRYVLVECRTKPWNTPDTRKTFLANLYIKEILLRVNMSKKIKRPEGYELLGAKCMMNDNVYTICGWREVVDRDTGEIIKQLTLTGRWNSPTPFKVLINQVQL